MPDEYGDFRDMPARIREIKTRDDQGEELEGLLLWCLAQTEDEAEQASSGVAASYYYELAVLYRKRRDYVAEVRVLERYAAQSKGPGSMPEKLAERLVRARELAGVPPPAGAPEETPLPQVQARQRTITVRPKPDPPPRPPARPRSAPARPRAHASSAPLSRRVKIAAGVGAALVVFSLPALFGDPAPSTSSDAAAVVTAAPADVVTFFEADRDSLLGSYAALTAVGRYDEADAAIDSAMAATSSDPMPTAGDLDTLTAARSAIGEARLVADAKRIPASDLAANERAYATLASRYPANPEYGRRRDDYAGRIEAEREAEARRAARQAARAAYVPRGAGSYGSGRTGGCCKQCSAGQPCGNSCISRSYACHQPPGCAC